jgi:hypothetical protein
MSEFDTKIKIVTSSIKVFCFNSRRLIFYNIFSTPFSGMEGLKGFYTISIETTNLFFTSHYLIALLHFSYFIVFLEERSLKIYLQVI